MKSLVQTYLIGGGVVGLVVSLPIAWFAWRMRSFGGELTGEDRLILCSPLICFMAIVAGVIWKRADQKRDENRRIQG